MHGLGNDFMIVNAVLQAFTPEPELIQQWSDRRTGIGFDQLLIAAPARNPQADFLYRIFRFHGIFQSRRYYLGYRLEQP